MKAIGYVADKSLDDEGAFIQTERDTPVPTGSDILVSIKAISVNPVDTKVRAATMAVEEPPTILGWDAAGIVEAVGAGVELFKPGDKVFYAGDITRPGSYASHQLVDERIVGRHPASLSFQQAAAMPLTSITAWEALFSRLKIQQRDEGKYILIIGAAGGVGSIAIQLAKTVARLEVIATASREESRQWCLSLGADHVINHHENMADQLKACSIPLPDYIFCLNDTDHYFPVMAELIAPQGMICSIVGGNKSHDLNLLKSKSAGFVWEFMFTRSMFQTTDMFRQHELLNQIADLLDSGQIKSTLNAEVSQINPDNICRAHRLLESGRSIGKIVLDGFDN